MGRKNTTTVPVGPGLSMFDPVYLGVDEFGHPVYVDLIGKNLLAGGEPGSGKSTLLHAIAEHASLCTDTRVCMLDGKQVELGMYVPVADEFVGPSLDEANTLLERVQKVLDNRYTWLLAQGRQKITRDDGLNALVVFVDEIALYSATLGHPKQQERFSALLRDVVARGRACGIVTIAATQRPNIDIIPTSLRDIFGYRYAGRCTTDNSSDLILGHGWASRGYTAASILPKHRGVGYLLDEEGTPRLIKTPWQTTSQIKALVDYATWVRHPHPTPPAAESTHDTAEAA